MAGPRLPEGPLVLGRGALIFVTIGSMFPFDRFVRLVDGLAPRFAGESFFAQIGGGNYEPRNMAFVRQLEKAAFSEKLKASRAIVAHAGMGSVISALEASKPIVIFPRAMEHGEHNTDHQMATARWLGGKPGIFAAFEEDALAGAIEAALESPPAAADALSASAPPAFVAKIRDFVDARPGRRRP